MNKRFSVSSDLCISENCYLVMPLTTVKKNTLFVFFHVTVLSCTDQLFFFCAFESKRGMDKYALHSFS